MRFHWTIECYGYALRNSANVPYAILSQTKEGYYGTLLETKLPSCGPFRQQTQIAKWIQNAMVKRKLASIKDHFSEFPYKRGVQH